MVYHSPKGQRNHFFGKQVIQDFNPLTHQTVLSDIELVAWGGRGCFAETIAAADSWSAPSYSNGHN